ncbi:Uncharacterized protein GBIM_12560 [Gryllus bimaculatus]|nr:Uncharacterized protein GBIM_12560 [Gryllus bimaculatus]
MQLVWPTVNAARAGRGGAGRAGGSRGSAAGRTDSVNAPPPAHTPARPLAHPSVRSHNQTPTYPPPRCPPVRPCVHLPARPTRRPDLPSAYPPTRGGGGGGGGSPRSWRFKKASDKEKAAAPPAGAAGLVNPAARPNAPQRDALILRRGLTDKFYHQQGALKVLLVFAKDDATVAALRGAAGQLGYECSLARNSASCVDAFQSRCHDLVIVDNRDPKTLDGEAIGKALRAVKSSQFSVFVALVKRSILVSITTLLYSYLCFRETEKQDCSILPYINAGYDRTVLDFGVIKNLLASNAAKIEILCDLRTKFVKTKCYRWVVEVTSAAPFVSELLQMDTSEVQPRKQLWAYHSFLLMAERSRELCIITDYSHHIVYANRAVERAVGSSAKELYGRCVYDLVHVDSRERLLNAAVKGREWEGVATVAPRRNSETMMLQCRVMPNGAVGRAPANLVFMLEPPPKRGSEAGMSGRGSVPSVRRGSADMRSVCSDGLRRQSVTKLNTLSIEAPITKVVTLISQAQEQSSPEVSLMLDKVVDILRTTELYSPVVREDRLRPDDPVTSDLISALLQRGGADDAAQLQRLGGGARRARAARQPQRAQRLHAALRAARVLAALGVRHLQAGGAQRTKHFEVPQTLNVDMNTVHNWLSIIEMNYRATNTYHNSSHAADVMQSSAAFLERERLQRILDPLDNACCLIAAAVHDVDHPGRSSAFLCNSDHELAILYNDICVLESHHAALAFRLTVSDERVNIFKGLERDVYKMVRLSIIDMVLATEMTKHFEHLAKFVNVFSKPVREDDESSHNRSRRSLLQLGADTEGAVMTQENIALAKRMLIKCADVSNPARPLRQCVEWALRIAEEYFQQTDEEKSKQLPVVMPMFDRASCSIPKSQIGFMDFIINDMFEAWEAFIEMPELMQNLDSNYRFWKEKEEQGICLPEDAEKLRAASASGGAAAGAGAAGAGAAGAGATSPATHLAPLSSDELAKRRGGGGGGAAGSRCRPLVNEIFLRVLTTYASLLSSFSVSPSNREVRDESGSQRYQKTGTFSVLGFFKPYVIHLRERNIWEYTTKKSTSFNKCIICYNFECIKCLLD